MTGLESVKSPWEEQRDGWSWQVGDLHVRKLLLMRHHDWALLSLGAEEGMELIYWAHITAPPATATMEQNSPVAASPSPMHRAQG